jgi:hypothetical protein
MSTPRPGSSMSPSSSTPLRGCGCAVPACRACRR